MNDMYNTFDKCVPNYYTYNSHNSTCDNNYCYHKKEFYIGKYIPKVSWVKGDTVSITFNLCDCDETIAVEDLVGKSIIIELYNFRFEKLPIEYKFYSNEMNGSVEFTIDIDREISTEYFNTGTYYCSVSLVTYFDDESINEWYTILNKKNCCFYVT